MAAKIKTVPSYKSRRHKHKPHGIAKKDFEKVYWPYIPLILIIVFLFSLSVQSGILQSSIKNPTGQTLDYALSMNIQRLLAETNSARADNGAGELRLNSKLYAAAQAKADDMATRNYWSHYTPDGQAPWVFVTAQNYEYQKLGENLATGFLDESGTIKGWMASKGHRANLIDPLFTEVGFGVANNPNYSAAGGGPMTIIVAMYGRPSAGAVTDSQPTNNVDLSSAPAAVNPATTESLSKQNDSGSLSKLSGAELALADLPFSSITTGLFTLVMLAAIGLWLTKHAVAVRRAFAYGEAFMIRHPMIDIGLIVIAALSLLLTKTAGIVG